MDDYGEPLLARVLPILHWRKLALEALDEMSRRHYPEESLNKRRDKGNDRES